MSLLAAVAVLVETKCRSGCPRAREGILRRRTGPIQHTDACAALRRKVSR